VAICCGLSYLKQCYEGVKKEEARAEQEEREADRQGVAPDFHRHDSSQIVVIRCLNLAGEVQ